MIEKSQAVAPVPDQATDPLIYRIVVVALSLMAILSLIAITALAFVGETSPEGIVALGSASVGALAGLLAPSPTR